MAYLRLLANPRDDCALKRVINKPARGIGPVPQAALRDVCAGAGVSMALSVMEDRLDGVPPASRKKLAVFADLLRDLAAAVRGVRLEQARSRFRCPDCDFQTSRLRLRL